MSNIPAGFNHCYAKFSLAGSSRFFEITCGFSNGVHTAAQMAAAWLFAISTGGGATPFNVANMGTHYTLFETGCLMTPITGPQTASVLPTTQIGTLTRTCPAPNTAVNVKKLTTFAGPRFRGRMSCPPCNLDESDITDTGNLSGGMLATQNSYWSAVYSSLVAGGFLPYLLHEVSHAPSPTAVPAPTAISSFEVTSLVGTSGSRLR